MSQSEASFAYRGKQFVGTVEVTGTGAGAVVRVRYQDREIEARDCGLPVEVVARTLLGELVMDSLRPARTDLRMPGRPVSGQRHAA